eukprot:6904972-Pyramimonas_sp.AAC.1
MAPPAPSTSGATRCCVGSVLNGGCFQGRRSEANSYIYQKDPLPHIITLDSEAAVSPQAPKAQ